MNIKNHHDSELHSLLIHFREVDPKEYGNEAKRFAEWHIENAPDLFHQILIELQTVVKNGTIPWLEINNADVHFKSEAYAKEWLKNILKVLEDEYASQRRIKNASRPSIMEDSCEFTGK